MTDEYRIDPPDDYEDDARDPADYAEPEWERQERLAEARTARGCACEGVTPLPPFTVCPLCGEVRP